MRTLSPRSSLRALGAAAVLVVAAPTEAAADWATTNVGGLDVRVYTPASTSPTGEGRALMVALHGCSQTADQLQQYGNFEAAADLYGVVIALPNVPNGGVIAGCWDYYGPMQSRTTKHSAPVVAMTEALRDDPSYDIDPEQMYVTGLSSGGGQALVLGCVAPDLFAGVGVIAGPVVGSDLTQIAVPATTGAQAATLCQQLAGTYADALRSQIGIVFNDSNDFTVSQEYGAIDTEMFAVVMSDGIDAMTSTDSDMAMLPGAMPAGTLTVYTDAIGPRIARLRSMGVGHNWPAGSGSGSGGLTFVASQGLNFSMFAADFFASHNVRTGGTPPAGGSDDGGDAGDDDADPTAADDDGGSATGDDDGGSAAGGDDGTDGSAPASDDGGHCGCAVDPRAPSPSAPAALCVWVLAGLGAARRRRAR